MLTKKKKTFEAELSHIYIRYEEIEKSLLKRYTLSFFL